METYHLLQYVAPFMRAGDLLRLSAVSADLNRALASFAEVARVIEPKCESCCCDAMNAFCATCAPAARVVESYMRTMDSAHFAPFFDAILCWDNATIAYHAARVANLKLCEFVIDYARNNGVFREAGGVYQEMIWGAASGCHLDLCKYAIELSGDDANIPYDIMFCETLMASRREHTTDLCRFARDQSIEKTTDHGSRHDWAKIFACALEYGGHEMFMFAVDWMRRVGSNKLEFIFPRIFSIALKYSSSDSCKYIADAESVPVTTYEDFIAEASLVDNIEVCEHIHALLRGVKSFFLSNIIQRHPLREYKTLRTLVLKWITEDDRNVDDADSILCEAVKKDDIELFERMRLWHVPEVIDEALLSYAVEEGSYALCVRFRDIMISRGKIRESPLDYEELFCCAEGRNRGDICELVLTWMREDGAMPSNTHYRALERRIKRAYALQKKRSSK
jgi:hypothetical protein